MVLAKETAVVEMMAVVPHKEAGMVRNMSKDNGKGSSGDKSSGGKTIVVVSDGGKSDSNGKINK